MTPAVEDDLTQPYAFMNGYCDSFALALLQLNPTLKFAVIGQSTDDGWWPTHYLVHDEQFAYDASGKYLVESLCASHEVDVVQLNENVQDWLIDGQPENGDARAEALKLIPTLPWLSEIV